MPDRSPGPPDDRLPEVRDDAADQLRNALGSGWQRAIGTAIRDLDDDIRRQVPRPSSATVGSREAAQYLAACIDATHALLLKRHRPYAPLRWLWYLRRAPDELFDQEHPTTGAYDRALAEAMTWFADAAPDEPIASALAIRFPINESVARHVLRLVGGIKYLSQLHVLARYAGKQASFRVATPLAPIPDERIRNAVAIYDARLADATAHIFAGLGLAGVPDVAKPEAGGPFEVTLLGRCRPHRISCEVPHDGGLAMANVTCRAMFHRRLPASHFLLPFGRPLEDDAYPEGPALALLMFQMAYVLFLTRAPWSLSSLLRHGYFVVPEELALQVLDDALPLVRESLAPMGYERNLPATAAAWLAALEATPPSLWPFVRGGFVRRWGALLGFDVTASSQAVIDAFRANRLAGDRGRGKAFERSLQAAIDDTPWCPPPKIRELQGRDLRVDGRTVTDLDAVAARGRTLVLVSCKSIVYDAAYDAGQFSAINNARDTIVKALARWNQQVDELVARPLTTTYDFTGYDEVVRIVCTPFAPYVPDEPALAFVRPGLRANCTPTELVEWLRQN